MSGFLLDVWTALVEPARVARLLQALAGSAAVIVGAHLLIWLGTGAIARFFEETGQARRLLASGRADTLRGLLASVLRYGVDTAALLILLTLFGVPWPSLLAGVGIAGLAIGFGAQNLVRDVISGFFILFEDQFRVGDHVQTDGVEGIVEEMGLRVTRIRDFGGQLHILPNGRIERVTNFSRGPMRVMFPVPIAYDADVDRAITAVEQACAEFGAGDDRVLEGPRVLGLSNISDARVELLVWARVRNGQQWDVERELRLAIKRALDQARFRPPVAAPIVLASPGTSPAAEPRRPATPGSGSFVDPSRPRE